MFLSLLFWEVLKLGTDTILASKGLQTLCQISFLHAISALNATSGQALEPTGN